jgi:hypothetical protein
VLVNQVLSLIQPSTTTQKEAGPLSEYLFNDESFEEWSPLYSTNTFSIAVACLDVLDKGSKNNDKEGFSSSVINFTSISGLKGSIETCEQTEL